MDENPTLSLQLENVTYAEVAAALSEATGIPIRLSASSAPPVPLAPPPRALDERHRFDWSGVSFAQALRDLCARYGLFSLRERGGYRLGWSESAPPPTPVRYVGFTEQNGVRLFVRSVSRQYQYTTY